MRTMRVCLKPSPEVACVWQDLRGMAPKRHVRLNSKRFFGGKKCIGAPSSPGAGHAKKSPPCPSMRSRWGAATVACCAKYPGPRGCIAPIMRRCDVLSFTARSSPNFVNSASGAERPTRPLRPPPGRACSRMPTPAADARHRAQSINCQACSRQAWQNTHYLQCHTPTTH